MKLVKLEPSKLAKLIAKALFNSYATPTVYYPELDIHFDGERDREKMKDICEMSVGPFYKAAGFYYILCWSSKECGRHIAVHKDTTRVKVGEIHRDGEELYFVTTDATRDQLFRRY